jgi:hypothetical protein
VYLSGVSRHTSSRTNRAKRARRNSSSFPVQSPIGAALLADRHSSLCAPPIPSAPAHLPPNHPSPHPARLHLLTRDQGNVLRAEGATVSLVGAALALRLVSDAIPNSMAGERGRWLWGGLTKAATDLPMLPPAVPTGFIVPEGFILAACGCALRLMWVGRGDAGVRG